MISSNRKRGNCRCCGGVDCTCDTCNFVVVLTLCGSRGVADEYEIRFQDTLITTITDDNTATGCRVFVIGDLTDVCESVVSALETTHGATAVEVVQTTALNDITNCQDEIPLDADCTEVTLSVTPLDGVSVDMSYAVYTTCHEEARKNCCSLTSGSLSGGADEEVSFNWVNPCCVCCEFWNDCCVAEAWGGTFDLINGEIVGGSAIPDFDVVTDGELTCGDCPSWNSHIPDGDPVGAATDLIINVVCSNGFLAVKTTPYDEGVLLAPDEGFVYSKSDPDTEFVYAETETCTDGYSYAVFRDLIFNDNNGLEYEFDIEITCGTPP